MKIKGKKTTSPGLRDTDTAALMRLVEGRRYAELESLARSVLGRNGGHVLALKALSFALLGLGRDEEVLPVVDRALALTPTDGELHNNRGIALSMLMHWDESIASFEHASRLSPRDPEVHKNLGYAWFRMRRWNEAVAALLKAIEVHPEDYVEAVELLTWALINSQRWNEAAACCKALHEGAPDDVRLLLGLAYVDLRRCEWSSVADEITRIRSLSRDFLTPVGNVGFALPLFGLTDREHAEIARNFAAADIAPKYLEEPNTLVFHWRPSLRRLKIGYLSGDFRRHVVASAVAEVIERHDRSRIEVFAYSTMEDDGSELRRRLKQGFEHFVDLAGKSAHAIVQRIRDDGIDILVDLSGWTAFGRVECLAARCAPIQVNWLGYPGTLGHRKLADYLIGDALATPHSSQEDFFETLVHMPNSFMPIDTTRAIGSRPTRTSQGLPEEAFVLCSFNNTYKFNPPLFDLWGRLLAQMPDAVLWLPRHNDAVAENLRREVTQRGIGAERLIFASHVDSTEEHLGRLQLADLALDTFPYNSHSTGADTLWAGVPMVAKVGETFAGRVGASLLHAAGLPELVAADEEGYADIVMQLYRDRQKLAEMRNRLRAARESAPLFDMARFSRDLENLYVVMAENAVRASEFAGAPLSRVPEQAS